MLLAPFWSRDGSSRRSLSSPSAGPQAKHTQQRGVSQLKAISTANNKICTQFLRLRTWIYFLLVLTSSRSFSHSNCPSDESYKKWKQSVQMSSVFARSSSSKQLFLKNFKMENSYSTVSLNTFCNLKTVIINFFLIFRLCCY